MLCGLHEARLWESQLVCQSGVGQTRTGGEGRAARSGRRGGRGAGGQFGRDGGETRARRRAAGAVPQARRLDVRLQRREPDRRRDRSRLHLWSRGLKLQVMLNADLRIEWVQWPNGGRELAARHPIRRVPRQPQQLLCLRACVRVVAGRVMGRRTGRGDQSCARRSAAAVGGHDCMSARLVQCGRCALARVNDRDSAPSAALLVAAPVPLSVPVPVRWVNWLRRELELVGSDAV